MRPDGITPVAGLVSLVVSPMKQDIDQRHGERIIQKGGCIKFYCDVYEHPKLNDFIGFPVIVKGYGYLAIDVYLIERKIKGRWGKGAFLCMIEANQRMSLTPKQRRKLS